jgi:uncharacterized protein (TIGR02284 family)
MAELKAPREILQGLVEISRDAQTGFREFAEKISDPAAKTFFQEKSLERANFAGELESELHRLGQRDVEQSGTMAGSAHRGWANLKSALGGGDQALLDEAERGEDAAKKAYQEALEHGNLAQTALPIVQAQYESILATHNRVKQFRDQRKAA